MDGEFSNNSFLIFLLFCLCIFFLFIICYVIWIFLHHCGLNACSMHLSKFSAIFIPISERFFLSSHTGLWRLCRYALTPILLTNSTLPQYLTKLIITNPSEIAQLKKDVANEAYIEQYIRNFNGSISNITSIDNQFKQTMFAHWVRETFAFPKLRTKYKMLVVPSDVNAGSSAKHRKTTQFVIVNNSAHIEDILKITPVVVQLNSTQRASVILPKNLQQALYDEWTQQPKVIRLLGKYAKDMNLPLTVSYANDTQLLLRPLDPPIKGNQNTDYQYIKYGMHIMNLLNMISCSKDTFRLK